jgi:hypothetical protein
MNTADPFEGAFAKYGSNWIGAPYVDGRVARISESWCRSFNGSYGGGAAPSTTQPGVIQLTESSSPGAAATTINVGSNLTWGTTVGSTSTAGIAGYGQPAAEPLAVRRFYHWNKSATAGAAGRPNGPQKEDVADTRPIPDVIVADAPETVQATESAAVQMAEDEAVQTREHARRRRLVRRTVLSPRSLTSVAVVLAGQKRSMVGEEWRGHLLGEQASGLTQREQTRAARGFVLAAVRYRVQDAAALAWRPADAVLGSRTLSNLFVWGPVTVVLMVIVRHDGRFGLVADIQDPAALGAFLYGVIRTGRWWRGVKPPEPKARRARD